MSRTRIPFASSVSGRCGAAPGEVGRAVHPVGTPAGVGPACPTPAAGTQDGPRGRGAVRRRARAADRRGLLVFLACAVACTFSSTVGSGFGTTSGEGPLTSTSGTTTKGAGNTGTGSKGDTTGSATADTASSGATAGPATTAGTTGAANTGGTTGPATTGSASTGGTTGGNGSCAAYYEPCTEDGDCCAPMVCDPYFPWCLGDGLCGNQWDDCLDITDCCTGLYCDPFFSACMPP